MARTALPIIEALNSGDWPQVCAIADGSAADPLQTHYRVLKASILYRRGQMPLDAALECVRGSLESPPENQDLFAAVLCLSIDLLLDAGDTKEAQRIAGLVSGLRPSVHSPELDARILYSMAKLASAQGQAQETSRLLDEALKLGILRGGPMWTQIKALRVHNGTVIGQYRAAQEDIDDLESIPGTQKHLSSPLAYLRACLCWGLGRHEQALALLDSIAQDGMGMNKPFVIHFRCLSLLNTNRLREAGELLDDLERNGQSMPQPLIEELRGMEALVRRDLDGARYHAKLILAGASKIHPGVTGMATSLLIRTELAAGRAQAARRLLGQMTPGSESAVDLSLLWARLHLIEGDEVRAARHFRQALQAGSLEILEDRLRWAWELSPSQLIRLWRLAQELPQEHGKGHGSTEAVVATATHGVEKDELVGQSPAISEIRRRIGQFAPLDAPVLVTGETGTGKEVVARLLHKGSPRSSEPFLAVNCGAMSDSLIESELFGHIKGAFTGAMRDNAGLFVAAGRGTIFLDEIHAMSPRLQASLLRVLENREVRPVGSTDVKEVSARVIAATNESLAELVEQKAFRMDLYFRLARLHVDVPPLRQRVEDIPVLARHFLRGLCGDGNVTPSDELLDAMKRYNWPGNIRELKHEIERIVLLSGDSQVLGASLFATGPRLQGDPASRNPPRRGTTLATGTGGNTDSAEPIRQLYKRHARLRELFDQHGRLTRADIIEFFKCSPNTATGDLKALEEEGYIRRVSTSGNLRTSYFVRAGRE